MTATTTPAQDEFNALVANNAAPTDKTHPEDRAADRSSDSDDADEEERYQQSRVDAAMRSKSGGGAASGLNLPPASFDNGRATGVKGVIADARSYEAARKSGKWRSRIDNARRSIFGMEAVAAPAAPARKRGGSGSSSSTGRSDDDDDDDFLRRWRESRKRELEEESGRPVVRNRRTSPSVREYGRLDEVDALGYLDAIEKVGRDTTVVVFVYDHEVRSF